MRIAIVSDIHSNLEALTKALETIKQHSADSIVCLGDIVGYGANPNECVDLVQAHCTAVVLGNHEDALFHPETLQHFSEHARSAIVWTHKRLTKQNLDYISSLPITHLFNGIRLVHASPFKPENWTYLFSDDDAADMFTSFPEPVCFIGHTHFPGIFSETGRVCGVSKKERFIINVGSVGQPRDRNPQLSFGLFDTDTWTYENIRVPYDMETASRKILDTDLPSRLAHRLLMGI
jgi:diadenosine tetraphosphatase ApaH/serine/threonine PP2A family protein phosphatase